MNKIYLITGMSASGKTTIANGLETTYGLKQIQSYTTRPMRYENETGHIFVNDEMFNNLKDLVGYTVYQNHRYAATSQQVEENDVYVINPDGIEYFKNNYKGNKKPVVIYVDTSIYNCAERMQSRGGMTFGEIMHRIDDDIIALRNVKQKADFIVENNGENADKCIRDVYSFIVRCENE